MARLAIHSEPPVVLFAIPFIYNILQQHPALTKMVHRNPNGVRRYRVPYRVRTGEELAGIPVYEAAEEDSTQFEPFGDDKIADAMVKPDDASEAAESVTSSSSDSDSEGEEEETEVSIAPAVTARPKEAAPHQQLGVDPFDETMLDMSKCGALDSSLWELTVLACHYNPTISTLARVFSTKWAQQRKPVEVCRQNIWPRFVLVSMSLVTHGGDTLCILFCCLFRTD